MRSIKKYKEFLRNLKYNLIYLMKYNLFEREKDMIFELTDKIIEDCVYEYEEDKVLLPTLNILDAEESIKLLLSHPKSFCRFGDGEIQIMKGFDQPFQEYDPLLAKRLSQIIAGNNENIYVGLNRAYFHTPIMCSYRNRKFYRLYSRDYRRFFLNHCNHDSLYIDAGCLTAYYRFSDDYDYEKHYKYMKRLFSGRKIAIVSGEGILGKFQYDVFSEATKKIVIDAPSKNAFSQYEKILDDILSTVPKDYIVCIILGMTAKILVEDLTEKGYVAWDIGHLAKDYDVYMRKEEKNEQNINDFWAPD